MHAPPLPVHGLPGGSVMGWHLWAHLSPAGQPVTPADSAAGSAADSAAGGVKGQTDMVS
jgi:hypothetical protein